MNIVKATRLYEEWLGAALSPLSLIPDDLELKHGYMADDPFSFMRATYYRWAQRWDESDSDDIEDLKRAPTVLAVGDIHTDNFGSWRDVEGRLVWGINDFDEAHRLPYTADLVRLTASACLALDDDRQPMEAEEIAAHVLSGYAKNLKNGGAPVVLAEQHRWLHGLIAPNLKEAKRFWEKLTLPPEQAPPAAIEAIDQFLPAAKTPYRTSGRTAGVGSLGRPRYVALMELNGAYAAREAKPLLNSAATLEWLTGERRPLHARYNEILDRAVRSRDPFMGAYRGWVVRRLSPDYVRIDLTAPETADLVGKALSAMGWELANVHAGEHRVAKEIHEDLKERGKRWLARAAEQTLATLDEDFDAWQQHRRKAQE